MILYRDRGRAERSVAEIYTDDPERGDAVVFGRRGVLRGASLTALGAAVGGAIPFAGRMPQGLLPAALAQPAPGTGGALGGTRTFNVPGKAPLIVLGERPLVAETPEHLLDDEVTPADKFYVRNNGGIPEPYTGDPRAWTIRIDGEVHRPLEITLGELERRFPLVTLRLQMECGGNGRSFFVPETRGNQWGNGAIGCAAWTGVRLRDLLQAAGLKSSAVYTGYYGGDPHLSGDPDRPSISRGTPIAKALEEHTLVALSMNGAAIPHIHGHPVRIITPGWPGSVSPKWLTRIRVRDREHDGAGMGGTSYRVPVRPLVPGSRNDGRDFVNLESMPVRAILTNLAHGARLPAGTRRVELRGHAWAGDHIVRAVHVSVDFGATWAEMRVEPAANRYAWQRWRGAVDLPTDGYYEVWYRATDQQGRMQPHAAANWNPQGYGANPISRISVLVASAGG